MPILTTEDAIELLPNPTKLTVKKLNDAIEKALIAKGIIKQEECKEHVPRFVKLASISGQEWEKLQWGFRCDVCSKRLHPTNFIIYDPDHHATAYRDPIAEIAKGLIS